MTALLSLMGLSLVDRNIIGRWIWRGSALMRMYNNFDYQAQEILERDLLKMQKSVCPKHS